MTVSKPSKDKPGAAVMLVVKVRNVMNGLTILRHNGFLTVKKLGHYFCLVEIIDQKIIISGVDV